MPMSVPGNSCRPCGSTSITSGCIFRLPGECVYYSGLTISGPGINTGDNLNTVINKLAVSGGGVTSVSLTMPAAFNVAGSPVTSTGTLAVTAAGNSSQYIRGDGALATLPVLSIGSSITSGTTGSVLFVGNSSSIAQNNPLFFWDNSNAFLGVGTNAPAYKLHVIRTVTALTSNALTTLVDTTGSTFNTTAAARTNTASTFTASSTKSNGAGFDLINVGVMGVATGGTVNYGIGTSNTSFTGAGYFYQSGNNTTKILGGPSTENITFGPDNAIRINSQVCGINAFTAVNTSPGLDAYLSIGAGTVSASPMRFFPGSLLSVVNDGSLEYDGTNLYFTVGGVRKIIQLV